MIALQEYLPATGSFHLVYPIIIAIARVGYNLISGNFNYDLQGYSYTRWLESLFPMLICMDSCQLIGWCVSQMDAFEEEIAKVFLDRLCTSFPGA